MGLAEGPVGCKEKSTFQVREPISSYPRVRVQGDGRQVVSQAGAVLLLETVRKIGLDQAISIALASWRKPRAVHDPGKILVDLALAVALGGDCGWPTRHHRPSQNPPPGPPLALDPRGHGRPRTTRTPAQPGLTSQLPVPTTAPPDPGSGTRHPPDTTVGPPACSPTAPKPEKVPRLRRRTLTKDRGWKGRSQRTPLLALVG